MSEVRDIVARHFAGAVEEAARRSIPLDTVARAFLDRVVVAYRSERSVEDVASELQFVAESLDESETDFTFMRP